MQTHKWRAWSVAGLLAVASTVSPVKAELVTYEFRGIVGDITDRAGVFGSPGSGTPFTLTYLADFSKGMLNGGGGGVGSAVWLSGGSLYSPDPLWPHLRVSPVSAVLEINGHALDFTGTHAGYASYAKNWYDGEFGVTGSSSATFYAYATNADGSMLSQVDSAIGTSSPWTFGALNDPLRLPLDASMTSSASFSYLWAAGSDHQTLITGDLMPESFTAAAAIPEPNSWATLGVGLLALMAVARARHPKRWRQT